MFNYSQPLAVFGPQTTIVYFRLGDLFVVSGCSKKFTEDAALDEFGEGHVPYVTTSAVNNGIKRLIGKGTEQGNTITIDSATVGSAFYQPLPFAGSDHVEKLTPRRLPNSEGPAVPMDEQIGLFLCALLAMEKFKYGYGRKFNQTRIEQTRLPLPIKPGALKPSEGHPYMLHAIDWDAIRELMRDVIARGSDRIQQQLSAPNELQDEAAYLQVYGKKGRRPAPSVCE